MKTANIDSPSLFSNPAFEPVRALTNRVRGILLLWPCLALLLAPVAWKLGKKTYSTEAILNIEPKVPRILDRTDPSRHLHSYEDWLRTQARIMSSYPILNRAVKNHESRGFIWMKPGQTRHGALARLAAKLKIKRQRQTQLITISMRSRDPRGLAEIVNAVVESYQQYTRNKERGVDVFKIEYLTREKEKTENELARAYAELNRIARSSGAALHGRKPSYMEAYHDLRRSLNRVKVERILTENKLNSLRSNDRRIRGLELRNTVRARVAANPLVAESTLNYQKSRRKLREKMALLKPRHPRYRLHRAALARLQRDNGKLRRKILRAEQKAMRANLLHKNRTDLISVRAQLGALRKSEAGVMREVRRELQKALGYGAAALRAETRRADIARLQARRIRINERLDQVRVDLIVPGRVELVARARPPRDPSSNRRPLLLGLCVFAALAGSLVFNLGLEWKDRRIRDARGTARTAGFPVTATLPARDPLGEGPGYKIAACAYEQEHLRNDSRVFAFAACRKNSTALLLARIDAPRSRKLLIHFGGDANHESAGARPESGTTALRRIRRDRRRPFHSLRLHGAPRDLAGFVTTLRGKYDYVFLQCRDTGAMAAGALHADVGVVISMENRTEWPTLRDHLANFERANMPAISVLHHAAPKPTSNTKALTTMLMSFLPRKINHG